MKKLLYILLILLVCSVNCFALTKGEIRQQIRNLIGDTTTNAIGLAVNSLRWQDDILNVRIEMAQLDIVTKSRCLQKTTYYVTITSISIYALPSDLLLIQRVAYHIKGTTDAYKKIERVSLFGLDDWNNYWQNLGAGLPERYYVWGSSIGLVPKPSATYSGTNKLQIDYIYRPSSLSNDNSVPFNNVEYLYSYHELIIWYVVALCKSDDKLYNESQLYWTRYYDLLKVMIGELADKPDFFPNFRFISPGWMEK